MDWCAQGSETYSLRRELFLKQKAEVEEEMARMGRVLDMLKYKCWYYDEAIRNGGEETLTGMPPENMPEEIRRAYENAHATD